MKLFSRTSRAAWLCLAWACVGLGTLGAFLPLLPTTPFILVAAWAAPKGSPRLDAWLRNHPRFGPLLEDWRNHRAVPRRAKRVAVVMLVFSWLLLWWLGASFYLLAGLAVLFLTVSLYLYSRPDAERS